MVWIFSFVIVLLCFLVFMNTYWIWSMNQARRRGLYPPKDKATLFHVRQLILEGEKPLAMRLYAQIYKTNYWTAKKAVDELEHSIESKKIDS